jgi:hypothetical protein
MFTYEKPKEITKSEKFKEIARYLLNESHNVDNEIILRTVINRYYYYVFLYLREHIAKIDGREEVKIILYPSDEDNPEGKKPKIGAHTFLLKYIKHVANNSKICGFGDNTLAYIVDAFSELLTYRKLADYNLKEDLNEEMLEDVKGYVEDIESYCEKLFDVIANLQGMGKLPKCDDYIEQK